MNAPQNKSQSHNTEDIAYLNSQKKVVKKYVEVTTKTILYYEDGSKKEYTESDNHTFNY